MNPPGQTSSLEEVLLTLSMDYPILQPVISDGMVEFQDPTTGVVFQLTLDGSRATLVATTPLPPVTADLPSWLATNFAGRTFLGLNPETGDLSSSTCLATDVPGWRESTAGLCLEMIRSLLRFTTPPQYIPPKIEGIDPTPLTHYHHLA